jgi:hypothetical protein
VNGIQTAGNIFNCETVSATPMELIIRSEIENYRSCFERNSEGFLKNWPSSYNLYGWIVSMKNGGSLAAHMHDSGWVTGSIYINVPPKGKTENGDLVVSLFDQAEPEGLSKNQETRISVITGNLCLFPASLHHYTVPFEEEESRVVLAFDVIPSS